MVKKIEKYLCRGSFLVQFETLSWFKVATLLKTISFAGILQRFWPEVKNSYFVEHCLMTNTENIKICNSLLYHIPFTLKFNYIITNITWSHVTGV